MAIETDRRVYTPELQAEAVELTRAGEPLAAVAALLDVPEPIVRMWVLRAAANYGGEQLAPSAPRAVAAPRPVVAPQAVATPRPVAPAANPAARCIVCGRGPAIDVTLRSVTGIVIAFRMKRIRGTFCRDCGIAMTRRTLNRTLLAGWWGLFAGFANFYAAIVNFIALGRFRSTAAPTGDARATPLPHGAPLFRRAGVYVSGLVVLASVAFVGLGAIGAAQLPSAYNGKCVAFEPHRVVRQPDCTGAHDGRVVGVVGTSTLCPPATDATLRLRADAGKRLCIDLDQ